MQQTTVVFMKSVVTETITGKSVTVLKDPKY